MRLSNHAQVRAQQRGIEIPFLYLLQEFGDTQDAGAGCVVRFFGRKGKTRLEAAVGLNYLKKHSEDLRAYIIECRETHSVVTAGKLRKNSRVSHFSGRCKSKSDYFRRNSGRKRSWSSF